MHPAKIVKKYSIPAFWKYIIVSYLNHLKGWKRQFNKLISYINN